MQELGYVCHDGPLIWFLHVNILRIQQPGDAQLALRHVEGVFQALPVRLPLHLRQVDQVRLDGVDDRQERDTVPP